MSTFGATHLVLGRYELDALLGEGGMGRAYLARATATGDKVVVKVMHDKYKDDLRFHELFNREMAFLRQFQHPHVVALLETGVDPVFGPCIVMEYLEGLPLCDLLVTGAGQGVGRQAALHLASHNAGGVIVNDFVQERAEAVAEEIRARGGKALPYRCDVTKLDQVKEMVAAGAEMFGSVDILVN
ncbi:MAG TPA: SDR family NAD(P)-dependent oxidoreductase, partial [Gemmatales bacterium]|nr:SDR family NAD(P)-dependent oxidoreductase [Gemmatales bacterium]